MLLSGNPTQRLSFSIGAVMEKDLGESKLRLKQNFPCPKAVCVHVLFVFCDPFALSGEATRHDVKSREPGFEV